MNINSSRLHINRVFLGTVPQCCHRPLLGSLTQPFPSPMVARGHWGTSGLPWCVASLRPKFGCQKFSTLVSPFPQAGLSVVGALGAAQCVLEMLRAAAASRMLQGPCSHALGICREALWQQILPVLSWVRNGHLGLCSHQFYQSEHLAWLSWMDVP